MEGVEGCRVITKASTPSGIALRKACELLGVDAKAFVRCLTVRELTTMAPGECGFEIIVPYFQRFLKVLIYVPTTIHFFFIEIALTVIKPCSSYYRWTHRGVSDSSAQCTSRRPPGCHRQGTHECSIIVLFFVSSTL